MSLIKIWILFHPAKQAWLNRGARTLDTTKNGAFYRLGTMTAHYLYAFTCAMTIILVGIYSGFLPVLNERPLFAGARAATFDAAAAVPPATSAVVMFGQEPEGKGETVAARRSPEVSVGTADSMFTLKVFSDLQPSPLTPAPADE